VLWRLRRATTMETGLFEIQAEHLRDRRQQMLPSSREVIQPLFDQHNLSDRPHNKTPDRKCHGTTPAGMIELAHCFLRLANLPKFALDRLSRYEATLWRQAGRILYALDALERRKRQERSWRSSNRSRGLAGFERE
jgi:hypothetical protein